MVIQHLVVQTCTESVYICMIGSIEEEPALAFGYSPWGMAVPQSATLPGRFNIHVYVYILMSSIDESNNAEPPEPVSQLAYTQGSEFILSVLSSLAMAIVGVDDCWSCFGDADNPLPSGWMLLHIHVQW